MMRTKQSKNHQAGYFYQEKPQTKLDRYRLLVDSVEDYAIFLLDENGFIASWNPGAQKFKGYKADEILGKHFSVFYPAIDNKNKKPERELEEALAKGRVEDEGWRIRKDGSRFWASVVITTLYDNSGQHVGFAKVTRDLTERKRYEDDLYNSKVKLETAYKELELLNAAKDEFVSLASHQLRTPATGVKQYLGLLIEGFSGELTEQQMYFLNKAYMSNDRQIEIINDLLHVAQLDAGKVILKKKPTDLHGLIADILDEQVGAFKSQNQKISVKSSGRQIANIDPVRFRMVLENLIENAHKYTPKKGKITVVIGKEGNFHKISVEDTGIGIKKADIIKVFEKFTRISDANKVTGSGLGLYWVKKVTELHGGFVKVTSQPNKGSVFNIIIPIESIHA